MKLNMPYKKRKGIYEGSNVTFDPEKFEARSYQHWVFVLRINSKVIFNNYAYSISTQKHQSKLRTLFDDLGIKIDFEVETSASLSNLDWQEDCLLNATISIHRLIKKEKYGRAGSWASEQRKQDIAEYEQMIKNIKSLTEEEKA